MIDLKLVAKLISLYKFSNNFEHAFDAAEILHRKSVLIPAQRNTIHNRETI